MELILQVGSKAGFAMVFALLVAAIIWNLGTWYFGLPASSSHTLIGSIIGVGIANQLMAAKNRHQRRGLGTGDEYRKVAADFADCRFRLRALLLLLLMKALIKDKQLYEAPEGTEPPPFWIRALLILTCTGVSFAHGSNDGQKGMGLIMLILIGTVPTAYALNHAVTHKAVAGLHRGFAANGGDSGQVCHARCGDRRPARRSDGLHPHQGVHAEHHAGAARNWSTTSATKLALYKRAEARSATTGCATSATICIW